MVDGMNIDVEIENLSKLRDLLMEHKNRLTTLNMSTKEDVEKSIKHLDVTVKRLRTTKRLCETKQSKLDL